MLTDGQSVKPMDNANIELDAQKIASLDKAFAKLGDTINRSAGGYVRQIRKIDFLQYFQFAPDVALKHFNSEEFQRTLRENLVNIRLTLEELRENAPEDEQEIFDSLIEISDALPLESPNAETEIDVSDCVETIFAGIDAARENTTEEQQVIYDDLTPREKDGKSFLTADRAVSILVLLVAIYTAIFSSLQAHMQSKTDKRMMEIAENTQRIEREQLDANKAIFNAVQAIGGKLDALNAAMNSKEQVANDD